MIKFNTDSDALWKLEQWALAWNSVCRCIYNASAAESVPQEYISLGLAYGM